MDYLWKIAYQNAQKAEALYERYMTDGASVMLPFEIRPLHGERAFPLFYRASNGMLLQMERIYRADERLRTLAGQLPQVAREDFLSNLIIEELYTTNEIERVQSTRAEIADSVRHVQTGGGGSTVRFTSMIQSYLALAEGKFTLPETLADIRRIYDAITEGEIAPEDQPDGRWFRQGAEDVSNAVGRVIHQGVMPEARIEEWMQTLLRFMAAGDVPALIQVAVAHYVFAYVHPFYDGNGRTGRFLSSLYLSEICSEFTAYSLSQGCRMQQKLYYEIFDRTNKHNSFGEMNTFIDGFLQIVADGQEKIYEDLADRSAQLDAAARRIAADARADSDLKCEILYVLEQKRLFASEDQGMDRRQLTDIVLAHTSDVKRAQINRAYDTLEAAGCIARIKGKPIVYRSMLTE